MSAARSPDLGGASRSETAAALSAFQRQAHARSAGAGGQQSRRLASARGDGGRAGASPSPSVSAQQQHQASVGLGTALLVDRLSIADLPRHVHRVFFIGHNAPAQPLCLLPRVPPELAAVVSEAEYAAHAHACNDLARWRGWEVRVANLLRVLWLPGALAFEASRRAAHVRALQHHHREYDHAFLRVSTGG